MYVIADPQRGHMALSQKYCVQPEKLCVHSKNIYSLTKLLHSPGKHNT